MQALPLRMESHNILFDDLKRKSKSKVALTQMESYEQQATGLLEWSKTKRKRIELASQGKRKSKCYLSVVKKA